MRADLTRCEVGALLERATQMAVVTITGHRETQKGRFFEDD